MGTGRRIDGIDGIDEMDGLDVDKGAWRSGDRENWDNTNHSLHRKTYLLLTSILFHAFSL